MANESEKITTGPEHNLEQAAESAREQAEKLINNAEKTGERPIENNEQAQEKARFEALESAVSVESQGVEKKKPSEPSLAIKRRGPISKKERDVAFANTMEEAQKKMKPSSRAFSKVIHTKFVEKTSDVVGTTIARPNAILSGAITAFIFTLVIYLLAKNLGYPLSGFESIAAFAVGWVVGILFDYFKVMIVGKK